MNMGGRSGEGGPAIVYFLFFFIFFYIPTIACTGRYWYITYFSTEYWSVKEKS